MCVWLDLANDPKRVAAVGVIEEIVKQKLVELIVPRIMLDEFGGRVARLAER